MATKAMIIAIHDRLLAHFGPQHWWPGETPLEIMVGAILTQNTNWTNVARAIAVLKGEGLLSHDALQAIPVDLLAEKIRSSGYYNMKAQRLKNLLALIEREYSGNLDAFLDEDGPRLRERLLSVKGIGPETADSILLYAAAKPVFVIDAYTYRLLTRHGLIDEEADYDAMQTLFMDVLPLDADLFNEYHALIVRTGKEFCRKTKPLCQSCPLGELLA